MTPIFLLTRATAWIALLFYIAALTAGRSASARRFWSLGFAALAIHTLVAFGEAHQWSWQHAHEYSLERTLEQTGQVFEHSLAVNFAFLGLWAADVLWWWLAPRSYESRPAAIRWLVQGAFAFMFVNGAIVFASGVGRGVGLGAFAALLWRKIKPNPR